MPSPSSSACVPGSHCSPFCPAWWRAAYPAAHPQPSGAEKIFGLGELSAYETKKLNDEVFPELKASIAKGEKFVADRK